MEKDEGKFEQYHGIVDVIRDYWKWKKIAKHAKQKKSVSLNKLQEGTT